MDEKIESAKSSAKRELIAEEKQFIRHRDYKNY